MSDSRRNLLYLEPNNEAALDPLIDELTRKMTAAFRGARPGDHVWMGIHHCICGAASSCIDYYLSDGTKINTLCVHYLAYHRDEVPEDQQEFVHTLNSGVAEPGPTELKPPLRINQFRHDLESYLYNPRVVRPEDLEFWNSSGLNPDAFRAKPEGADARWSKRNLLLAILYVSDGAVAEFASAVQTHHQDIFAWGSEALCFPGWKAELWVRPIADIIASPQLSSMSRFGLAFLLSNMRPASLAILPRILDILRDADEQLSRDVIPALALLDFDKLTSQQRAQLLDFAQNPSVSPMGRLAAISPFRQRDSELFHRICLDVATTAPQCSDPPCDRYY